MKKISEKKIYVLSCFDCGCDYIVDRHTGNDYNEYHDTVDFGKLENSGYECTCCESTDINYEEKYIKNEHEEDSEIEYQSLPNGGECRLTKFCNNIGYETCCNCQFNTGAILQDNFEGDESIFDTYDRDYFIEN